MWNLFVCQGKRCSALQSWQSCHQHIVIRLAPAWHDSPEASVWLDQHSDTIDAALGGGVVQGKGVAVVVVQLVAVAWAQIGATPLDRGRVLLHEEFVLQHHPTQLVHVPSISPVNGEWKCWAQLDTHVMHGLTPSTFYINCNLMAKLGPLTYTHMIYIGLSMFKANSEDWKALIATHLLFLSAQQRSSRYLGDKKTTGDDWNSPSLKVNWFWNWTFASD